jgi:phytanoyl-CoA hydroxylase
MLFDHSTTGPHQDWIYLDSRPNGHLIAAWIALEDILPQGTRFYVYPGTHHFVPRVTYNRDYAPDNYSFYKTFLSELGNYLEAERPEMYAPPLRKGDIFFWGSRIIHGSTPGTDPRFRRRSIAAHFVLDGFRYGNLEGESIVPYRERFGLRYAYYEMDREFEYQNAGPIKRWARRVRPWAGRIRRRLNSVWAGSGTERNP